jgi:hypothetical protein
MGVEDEPFKGKGRKRETSNNMKQMRLMSRTIVAVFITLSELNSGDSPISYLFSYCKCNV